MLTRDTSIDATKIGYCFWMARELGLLPQERSKSGLRELVSSEHAKVIGTYLQEFGGTIGYWNGVGIAATAAGFAVASAHKLSNLPTTAKSYSSDDLHSLHEALVVMMDDALGRKDMAILALGTETTHAWLNVIDQRYEAAITRDYAYFDIRSMWESASRRSLRIRILHGLEPIFHRTTVHPSHSGGSL